MIFRSKCRLNTLFHFKDWLEKKFCSGIIYRYRCTNCNVTYYGKTFCHFYTRTAEHMEIFNLTGKLLKSVQQSAISEHLLQCNCTINFDNSGLLCAESNKFKLLLRERFLIKRYNPILTRTIKSYPLQVFDFYYFIITWLSGFYEHRVVILMHVLKELGFVLICQVKQEEKKCSI